MYDHISSIEGLLYQSHRMDQVIRLKMVRLKNNSHVLTHRC